MRDACNALLDALALQKQDQSKRIDRAAEVIRQTQKQNAAARASHAKARAAKLKEMKIRFEEIRSCLPP